jgi:4-hydroxybenzoate polyprenyltransferase
MTGYLLFNPLSLNLIFVALSSFFVCAGAYAYNNITDRKEDLINRKRVNFFSLNNKSLLIVISCFLLGIFFSLLLSPLSVFFCMLFITVGVFYSFFRIKQYLLIKNLYTGFGITVVFLIGIISFSSELFWYYFLISVFFFTGSLISDLRDCEGDESVDIKTLPVLEYNLTRKIIYFLLITLSVLVLGLNLYNLFPMLVFIPIILFFLIKNKPVIAHLSGGISIIFLVAWLMIV